MHQHHIVFSTCDIFLNSTYTRMISSGRNLRQRIYLNKRGIPSFEETKKSATLTKTSLLDMVRAGLSVVQV